MPDTFWDEPPDSPQGTGMTLERLLALMADLGVSRVYAKSLAANDNSKQQVYAGPGFEALNIFPNGGIQEAPPVSGSVRPRFYARVDFSWLAPNGEPAAAPEAKLILYPRYPEVRFSGFLARAEGAPSEVMTSREVGRVLLIGVRDSDAALFGYVDTAGSVLRRQVDGLEAVQQVGVFRMLSIVAAPVVDWRRELLRELGRVATTGWITGRRLNAPGVAVPCNNRNCGGLTLEAELGIVANANAEPDYHGWELKAHSVRNLTTNTGGPITLMTQEPTGGYYATAGFRPFMRKFGYPDRSGIADRINFGGVFRVGQRAALTGLTMTLDGYEPATGKVDLATGQLALMSDAGEVALAFPVRQLLDHWAKKHALAAYVPYLARGDTPKEYQYGTQVRLGLGTDGLTFLRALAAGTVYYDPGPKLEAATSTRPIEKRRSQLRVASADALKLYKATTTETVPPT